MSSTILFKFVPPISFLSILTLIKYPCSVRSSYMAKQMGSFLS
jgi:hypothetical protein